MISELKEWKATKNALGKFMLELFSPLLLRSLTFCQAHSFVEGKVSQLCPLEVNRRRWKKAEDFINMTKFEQDQGRKKEEQGKNT